MAVLFLEKLTQAICALVSPLIDGEGPEKSRDKSHSMKDLGAPVTSGYSVLITTQASLSTTFPLIYALQKSHPRHVP